VPGPGHHDVEARQRELQAPLPGRVNPGHMTRAQFAVVLGALEWNNSALARALRCDEKLIRRWAAGELAIPARVASWLWSLAEVMRLYPPPREWRTVRPPGPRHGRDRSNERKGKSRDPAGKKSI
jgi:hypothetical protein